MPDRVLLVEDTASLSMVYQSVLTKAGHKVICAFSLAEAREQCETVRPHVVLLDLQLPDGDGLELLQSLRLDAPNSRVIVITANGSINRAVQAMRAGAFDFLVKPFDEARLLSAVHNAIASAPHPPEAEEAVADPEVEPDFQGFIGRSARHGRDLPHGPRHRPLHRHRLHHRRERHRQGGLRPRHPCRLHPRGKALRAAELRRHPARPARIRGLRPPEGRVHRRALGQAGCGGVGQRRNALSRRDLRDGSQPADQAPALPADLDHPARRRRPPHPGRRAHRLRHQPRPGRGGPPRPLPRGPLLPPARRPDPHAAAARPARGRHGHRPGEPHRLCRRGGQGLHRFQRGRGGGADQPPLARQRATAPERDPQHRRPARRRSRLRRDAAHRGRTRARRGARRHPGRARCRPRAAFRPRARATGWRSSSATRWPRSSAS